MSMTKGTPESSQIIWLTKRVEELEEGMWMLNQALAEWFEKTRWVQESIQPKELGLHRADVLRQRIERLTAQRDALLEALKNIDKEFRKNGRQHWPEAVKARSAIAKAEEKV